MLSLPVFGMYRYISRAAVPASSEPRVGQRPVGSPPDPAAQPARANKAVKLTRASSRPGTGGRPQPASNSSPFALLLRNAAARSTALAQQLSSTQTLFSPPRARLKPAPGTNSAVALPARSPAPTLRTPPWQPGDHTAQRRRNAVPQVVENCVLPLSSRTRFAQLAPGKRGKRGERGKRGKRGERGKPVRGRG